MKAAMPTQNPARTAEYLNLVDQRRADLRLRFDGLLGKRTEFVWEIGCGHGHFLAAYAAAHREQLCLGIDIARERIERGERKRKRAQLANLHFIHADAEDFLQALPPAARFSAIYILFPDPWPKRRHHKNRLMQPEFIAGLAQRAGQGTPLYFRTDYGPYFSAAKAVIENDRAWQISDETWPFETSTVFEQRAASYRSLVARRV